MRAPRLLVVVGLALLLTGAADPALGGDTKTVLLVDHSPDGHAAGSHEYARGVGRLAQSLQSCPGLKVRLSKGDEPWAEGPALLGEVDGVVLFLAEGARWTQVDPRRHEALARLAARGGGLVALHWALGTRAAEPIEPFLKLFGGCHGGPDRRYQVLDTELRVDDPTHPVTAGLTNFKTHDEFYYRLKFVAPEGSVQSLLSAMIDGRKETVAWSWQRPDGGRSFGFTGLHFDENWAVPEYARLVKQAVLWTMQLRNE